MMSGRIKWNYEMVKNFVESKGYKLISKEYRKAKDKLVFICPKNHQFEMTFAAFKNDAPCPVCSGRILTYDIVKNNIEIEGYKLMSTEYKNTHSKLLIECPKGHTFEMAYANFQQGQRCPKCAGVQKLTYEEVKNYIESQGYELLSTKYINNASKLLIKCPKGHVFKMTYSIFKTGSRCPKCLGKQLNYNEVKEIIQSVGYKLLSTKYINAKEKLLIECDKGHTFNMSLTKFNQGHRCLQCHNESGSNRKYTYEFVKEYIENEGYELLSTGYNTTKEKLLIKCDRGHIFEMSFEDFKEGHRCWECYKIDKLRTPKKYTYEMVKECIEEEGYKLLSTEYESYSSKLTMECPNGHKFKMSLGKFKNGRRCPKCKKSKGEIEISKILDLYNIKYEEEYRFENCKFKYTLPFDFYLPEYNTCIEYDGIQHFYIIEQFGGLDGFISSKIRDTIKNIYCENNNIKLIRIPYWEFNNIETIINEELVK